MFRIHSYLTHAPPCGIIHLPVYFFMFALVFEDRYGYLRPLSALHVLPGFLFASQVLAALYRSTRIRALGVLAVTADMAAALCLLLAPWERRGSFPARPVVAFALRTLGGKVGWGKRGWWWLVDVHVFCVLSPVDMERLFSSDIAVFVAGVLGCGCVLLVGEDGAGWAVINLLTAVALLVALLCDAAAAVLWGVLTEGQVYAMIVAGACGLVLWLRKLLSPFEEGLGTKEGEKIEGAQETGTGSLAEVKVCGDEKWMQNIRAGRVGIVRSRPRLSDIYWGPQEKGVPDGRLDGRYLGK